MKDGYPVMDENKCLHEGNCIASCPMDAWEEVERGYTLYVGSKIGRQPQLGQIVAEFIKEIDVTQALENVLKTYEQLHQKGERLAKVIGRVGLEEFKRVFEKYQKEVTANV